MPWVGTVRLLATGSDQLDQGAPQTTVRAKVTGTLGHVKAVEPVLDVSRTGTIVAG